jgi:hypothetical protein
MAKTRKPNTARKPPVPSDSHAEIEDLIRRVMPDLHPIVERLDALIRETIDGLQYAVKWKKAYYGLPELGWVIEMVAYDVSVNVVFLGGAEFDSPPPLGDTDRSRYVKVTTLEEAQGPEMHKWIEQAGARARLEMSRQRHAYQDRLPRLSERVQVPPVRAPLSASSSSCVPATARPPVVTPTPRRVPGSCLGEHRRTSSPPPRRRSGVPPRT